MKWRNIDVDEAELRIARLFVKAVGFDSRAGMYEPIPVALALANAEVMVEGTCEHNPTIRCMTHWALPDGTIGLLHNDKDCGKKLGEGAKP